MIYGSDTQGIRPALRHKPLTSCFCLFIAAVGIAPLGNAAVPVIRGEHPSMFGMLTPGGSGRHLDSPRTHVCKVVNLLDEGAAVESDYSDSVVSGDFRWCIEEALSPKTVVFEVSGNIELKKEVVVGGFTGNKAETSGSYITIAGETAPSPGITLKYFGLRIERSTHDIVITHLRVRPGDFSFYDSGCHLDPPSANCTKASVADPLTVVASYSPERGWYPARNIVIAHNSFTWGGDMTVQNGGEDISFIDNIMSESLSNPMHPKGEHSKGFASFAYTDGVAGARNVLLMRNLISHSTDRNPAIMGGTAIVANNYIYDYGPIRACLIDDVDDSKGAVKVALIGNYFQHSPRAPNASTIGFNSREFWPDSKLYVSADNLIDGELVPFGDEESDDEPWRSTKIDANHNWPDNDPLPPEKRAGQAQEAIWISGLATMSPSEAAKYVLLNAGARPFKRDAVDARIAAAPRNGEYGSPLDKTRLIASQSEVGGWPVLAENARALDLPTSFHELEPNGYTRLENWIYERFTVPVQGGGISAPSGLRVTTEGD